MTRKAGTPAFGWGSLTPAEVSVISGLVRGLTNPEIGRHLGISRRTVSSHLEHIFAKLDVRSRVDIVREALTQPGGIVTTRHSLQADLAERGGPIAGPVFVQVDDGGHSTWYEAGEVREVQGKTIITTTGKAITPGIPPGMTPAEFHYQRGLADARREAQSERELMVQCPAGLHWIIKTSRPVPCPFCFRAEQEGRAGPEPTTEPIPISPRPAPEELGLEIHAIDCDGPGCTYDGCICWCHAQEM